MFINFYVLIRLASLAKVGASRWALYKIDIHIYIYVKNIHIYIYMYI